MTFFNYFGDCPPVQSGLFRLVRLNEWTTLPAPVPIQSVNVNVQVFHVLANVEVTQIFINKELHPIEAIYYFPLDANGAIVEFLAEIEGKKIQGTIKESLVEAKRIYENAIFNENTALLGEMEQSDIFKISIGFLKPGDQVKIVIRYVTEISNVKDSNVLRFTLPTTVAPRYSPARLRDPRSHDMANKAYLDWINIPFKVPLSIKVDVYMPGDIESIFCTADYPVTVVSNGRIPDRNLWSHGLVELPSYKIREMDRDFTLLFVPKDTKHKPRLYTERLSSTKSLAVMGQLIPNFKLDEQKTELIFVLDRSGSMSQGMPLAKNVLTLLLRCMPESVYFNIVGFGTTHHMQFTRSHKCDVFNFQIALNYAENAAADMGGTEILPVLKELYNMTPIPGHSRQIFFITDGHVTDTDEIMGFILAKEASASFQNIRIFTIGIGQNVSQHFIEGLAQAAHGTSSFINSEENYEDKVLQQLRDSLQPPVTDVKLLWRLTNGDKLLSSSLSTGEKEVEEVKKPEVVVEKRKTLLGYGKPVTKDDSSEKNEGTEYEKPKKIRKQAQQNVPSLFDGSQLLVYGICPEPEPKIDEAEVKDIPIGLTIKAQFPTETLSVEIEESEESDMGPLASKLEILHKMAAIKLIKEMEQKLSAMRFEPWPNFREQLVLKTKISKIAQAEGILSKHTAILALDDINKSDDPKLNQSLPRRTMQAQIPERQTWTSRQRVNYPYYPRTWPTPSSTGFTFGASSITREPQTLFGGTSLSTPTPPTSFTFGQPSSTPKFSLFGQSSSAPSTSLFGLSAPASLPSTNFSAGTFGSSFGTAPPTTVSKSIPPGVSSSSASFSFGSSSTPSAPTFGSSSASTVSSAPTFGSQAPSSEYKFPVLNLGSTFEDGQQSFSFGSSGSKEMDQLNKIVRLQSQDGSFPLNESLASAMDLSLIKIKEGKSDKSWSDESWATALVLTFFIAMLGSKKFFWETTATKGEEWLKTKNGNQYESILACAKKFLVPS